MSLTVLNHPLAALSITRLRDKNTSSAGVVREVHKLSMMLAYEATRDLLTDICDVETPLGVRVLGRHVSVKHSLIPIMRAGDGMRPAFQSLFPNAHVWHMFMSRDEETLKPNFRGSKVQADVLPLIETNFILDPMLATGGSASLAIDLLKQGGARNIVFIGLFSAIEGESFLQERHPDVPLFIADAGDTLNERGYLRKGPGDMGDRLFGTV